MKSETVSYARGSLTAWRMHVFGGVLHAYTDPGADHPPVSA